MCLGERRRTSGMQSKRVTSTVPLEASVNSSIMSPPLAKERVVAVQTTFHKYGPFEEYPLGFKALRVLSCALGFRKNQQARRIGSLPAFYLPGLSGHPLAGSHRVVPRHAASDVISGIPATSARSLFTTFT